VVFLVRKGVEWCVNRKEWQGPGSLYLSGELLVGDTQASARLPTRTTLLSRERGRRTGGLVARFSRRHDWLVTRLPRRHRAVAARFRMPFKRSHRQIGVTTKTTSRTFHHKREGRRDLPRWATHTPYVEDGDVGSPNAGGYPGQVEPSPRWQGGETHVLCTRLSAARAERCPGYRGFRSITQGGGLRGGRWRPQARCGARFAQEGRRRKGLGGLLPKNQASAALHPTTSRGSANSLGGPTSCTSSSASVSATDRMDKARPATAICMAWEASRLRWRSSFDSSWDDISVG
jgi:hypothetical protein